jgi:hypothetical protein
MTEKFFIGILVLAAVFLFTITDNYSRLLNFQIAGNSNISLYEPRIAVVANDLANFL